MSKKKLFLGNKVRTDFSKKSDDYGYLLKIS